jgi:hypothetical protein
MKRLTNNTRLALSLIVCAGLLGMAPSLVPVTKLPALVEAASPNELILDVAADCRTFVPGPNRGDKFMVSGKIFPGGTLPSGAASNDPTQPVNGVAPIGDWLNRGQSTLPFPPNIAAAYSSTPPTFATLYYLLNNGQDAIIAEGYGAIDVNGSPAVLLSVTGGIGRFSGAAGDVKGPILGTNATGCPNGRAIFRFRPGSLRPGASN